jgi:hypothetical protein
MYVAWDGEWQHGVDGDELDPAWWLAIILMVMRKKATVKGKNFG